MGRKKYNKKKCCEKSINDNKILDECIKQNNLIKTQYNQNKILNENDTIKNIEEEQIKIYETENTIKEKTYSGTIKIERTYTNNLVKLNDISNIVAKEFYNMNLQSVCLASAMITKILIEKYTQISISLIKGFVKFENKYWGHFWLEYDNNIIDPGTEIWLLQFCDNEKKYMKKKRILIKDNPDGICIDSKNFETVQNESYKNCLNGNFWEDIENVAGLTMRFVFEDLLTDNIEPQIKKLI
jgi:hypothetical protein